MSFLAVTNAKDLGLAATGSSEQSGPHGNGLELPTTVRLTRRQGRQQGRDEGESD